MNNDLDQSRQNRGRRATDQQRKASNPLKSVWVQASAGTGKTKVLTDRVLRLLLQGNRPEKILCLTYTKAAAVEMSTRISSRLSRWAVIPTEELYKELESLLGSLPVAREEMEKLEAMARRLFAVLLDTPGGMKIQTIHSFCQEILKRFPIEAHISPYFEVMDERASKEALDEIKIQFLQNIEKDPESRLGQSLSYLTQRVSEFSFPNIMSSIANNRSKIDRLLSKYGNADAIVSELAKRLDVSGEDTEQKLIDEYERNADFAALKYLMEAWAKGGKKDIAKANSLQQVLESRDVRSNLDNIKSCFFTQKGEVFSNIATKDVLGANPEFESVFLKELEKLQELIRKISSVSLLQSTKAVLFLSENMIVKYNNFKSIHSKMDYEDLIVLTRKLLENTATTQWVLYKLDGGIDNILIDEAQDTSPDQWAIVKALTANFFDDPENRKRTVFAVGDKKQSIYSFQGADPKGFMNMQRHFADLLSEAGLFEEVNLEVSFRSAPAVLNMVNNVFEDGLARKGVAQENEDITHIPFRAGEAGKIELWPLVEPEEGENSDIWLPPVERIAAESTSSKLARQIAERIKKMVENKELLVSQNRPVRFSDFMILVQRRNSFVEELVRACKNANVNIAGVDKIKLLEQIAVQDLISLGKFLLLPNDDLTLAEVLKSPLFGLDDDDLFKLCYDRNSKSLWSRLGQEDEYQNVYKTLQTLLNMADFVRPFELYSFILNKLEGRKKFVSRLGYETEDGIDEFVNLTLSFEQEHIPSLQGFINWIGKDQIEIKRELEQSDIDAVRIMTVHGSKGLQSPIIILPDTVRVVNVRNETGMLWDDLFYYPLSTKDYDETCKKVKENEKERALEEYRRLLYVALTRAEDRLCVCGYYKSKKSTPKDESWYKIIEKSLRQIGVENQDNIVEYQTEQSVEPKAENIQIVKDVALPDFEWLYNEPEQEQALAKPLRASHLDEDEPALTSPLGGDGGNRYKRGLIIHKLLQFLPDIKTENREQIIQDFLIRNAADMSQSEMKRIESEVVNLLDDQKFAGVFSKNSKAEVPMMGMVDGRIISGQVDRLVVEDRQVLIVDYKTNRPAAKDVKDIPEVYIRQMAAYRSLLGQIYPEKEIRSLILWTDTATLMEVC